jgi:outer membrane immunogenic protein
MGSVMKYSLYTAVAALAFAGGSALAADLPVRAPTYKAPPPVYYSWSGFYIGGHLGYGWANAHWTTTDHAGHLLETNDQDPRGLVGGGQVGYRWQTGALVFGIEGTFSAARIRAFDPACGVGNGPLPCAPGVTVSTAFRDDRTTNIRSIATVTGQLGYAWNNALLYVKGGWAFADMRLENNLITLATGASACATPGEFSCAKTTRRTDGPTVGVGVEYGLLPNVSFGVEYDYIHLRGSDVTVASSTGFVSTFGDIRANVHEVLGRVNFRFGGY